MEGVVRESCWLFGNRTFIISWMSFVQLVAVISLFSSFKSSVYAK